MFDHYKSRMAHRGRNMSEMLRMQSNMVIEQTWNNDPNARQVYVVKATRGLPVVTDNHELIDVKFNVDTYQKVGADEPAYTLQFRHGAEKRNPDISVGSYVYMADEDCEWKWWMILGLDERPAFRQYHIAECNWKFGWIIDGKIYYHLGIIRNGSSTREADEKSYTSSVNGNMICWMATNAETQTIGHDQKFLISDDGRMPPLCYSVATISDSMPIGITKLVMSQSTFDQAHDSAELMLANYYSTAIPPEVSEQEPEQPIEPKPESVGTADIMYSGTKPTIKVGGSEKVFTPVFSLEGVMADNWLVTVDGVDITDDVENYTITHDDDNLKLQVALNYYLIGKIINIHVVGTDGSEASLNVEVI